MTLDANDKSKDVVPQDAGGDSEDASQQDSKPPKTYTEDEVERKFSSQRSVLDGKIAKLEKTVKTYGDIEKTQTKLRSDMEEWQKDRDAAELATAEPDDKSRIELIQRGRKLGARISELESDGSKKDERILQLEQTEAVSTKEQNARVIASKYEVDLDTLMLADDPEALAKKITGRVIPTLKPDSSKTIGGSASFEKIRDEMIKNPSNDAKMQRYLEAKKQRDAQR